MSGVTLHDEHRRDLPVHLEHPQLLLILEGDYLRFVEDLSQSPNTLMSSSFSKLGNRLSKELDFTPKRDSTSERRGRPFRVGVSRERGFLVGGYGGGMLGGRPTD